MDLIGIEKLWESRRILCCYVLDKLVDLDSEHRLVLVSVLYIFIGRVNGRVVLFEDIGDTVKGKLRHFSYNVDRNVTGKGYILVSLRSEDLLL